MILYFDTSAMIPLLVDEPASEFAGELWLSATRVLASRLVYPEACSALARAKRGGRLGAREHRHAKAELEDLIQQIDHIEVTSAVTSLAGSMTEQYELRAYDAVHLASAVMANDTNFAFVTNDQTLRKAALAAGLNAAQLR